MTSTFSLLFVVVFQLDTQMNTAFSNFYLEDGAVTYRHVYRTGGTQEEIEHKLKILLPQISGLEDVEFNGGVFVANIHNMLINYSKHGYDYKDIPFLGIKYPISARVIVQAKEGRYRILIRDIKTMGSGTFNFVVNEDWTNYDRSEFRGTSSILEAMILLNKDFKARFDINNIDDDW